MSSGSGSASAPPPPPPPPGTASSESREDESSPQRDRAGALVQAFPKPGSAPPPPPASSNSREDEPRSDPPRERGWALVHAFAKAVAEDSVPRGLDFKVDTVLPPKVTTVSIRASIFSQLPHGARSAPLPALLRLHCVDSTGHLFLISSLGSDGRRAQLLVCAKERGRVITVAAVPTDLRLQLSTRDAVVGIVAIPGGRSDADTDYVIAHLLQSSLGSVASADAPSSSAVTTSLGSPTFYCYESKSATWSTRHAAITRCNHLSRFHRVDSVLSLDQNLLGFVDLSCGLVLWSPLGEQASFLSFPQPEASTSSDTDYAIGTRRCFGRSDEQLVFVAIHDSPPSVSTWTCAMDIEGQGWIPQNHSVPLLDIRADPGLISASLLRWGDAAPSVILVHPHDSNSIFLSNRGIIFCVDLKKRNLIGLPQLITNGCSSVLSSIDFCLWVMPEVPDEVFSCWEMVQFDEIVNCNPDSDDRCSVFKLKLGNTPLSSQLLYSKYRNYAVNVLENNRSRLESLQQGAEWVGQFAPLADKILPVPVCSLARKASSHICQASKAGAVISRAVELLQSVISPPDHLVVLGVANEAQARDAVARWDKSGRSQWYFVELDDTMDHDQAHAVKGVLDSLQAGRLLWLFHQDLCAKPI